MTTIPKNTRIIQLKDELSEDDVMLIETNMTDELIKTVLFETYEDDEYLDFEEKFERYTGENPEYSFERLYVGELYV
jgi:hypothetical protein